MEATNIANQLKNTPAGFLPNDLFDQIARLGVLAYLEVVALRLINDKVEVLLTRRSEDDPFWPNLYHNPGTVLRPNDTNKSFSSALGRLYADEYAGSLPVAGPFFAGLWFDQLERGKGLGIVTYMQLDNCLEGKYFAIDNLPKDIIKGQAEYIKQCANQFTNHKRGTFNPTPIEQLILQ